MTRVVGLTGGIGSGKSTVARMFQELGAVIIDADALAKDAVAVGSPGLLRVVERFGEDVLLENGALDRKAVAAKVFADAAARKDLEAIVHPEVARRALAAMQAAIGAGAAVVIYDVPLLYENKLDSSLAEVIVVDVPVALQRERIAHRDGLSIEDIEARLAAQMPLDEKAKRATYLVDNSGTLDATRAQVEALMHTWVEREPS